MKDGPPVKSINGMLQSRDGYIWAATFDGLVRFDGVRFTVFNTANSDGLPTNRLLTLHEGRDSSLWIRTERSELVRFRQGRFTDDSVLTIATATVLLGEADYATAYRSFGTRYPRAGYGSGFRRWLMSYDITPYNSYGNGSAMRVGPVGFAFTDVEAVLEEAAKSASVSHNHPEGIKGAQATALAISRARSGAGRDAIRDEVTARFGYDLDRTLAQIRPAYSYDESCQGTVPEAIICALESTDWEDAIRKAISLGGDADTLAAIAGGIAEGLYGGIPDEIENRVMALLPAEFLDVIKRFRVRFGES